MLPGEPAVTSFMADFERGIWGAIRKVFPGKVISGCAFHWSKAVFTKVQNLGLQVYLNNLFLVFRDIEMILLSSKEFLLQGGQISSFAAPIICRLQILSLSLVYNFVT